MTNHAKIEWEPRQTPVTTGWPSRKGPSIAQQAAYAALNAAARRTVAREIKYGARRFALCVCSLDTIEAGLSRLTPHAMTRRLRHLFSEEVGMPRGGWAGGVTQKLTLKSALVYARWSLAVEHSIARRAVNARK